VWLVVVALSQGDEVLPRERLLTAEERCQHILLDRGAASIVRDTDMDLLPGRFLSHLESGRFEAHFI